MREKGGTKQHALFVNVAEYRPFIQNAIEHGLQSLEQLKFDHENKNPVESGHKNENLFRHISNSDPYVDEPQENHQLDCPIM